MNEECQNLPECYHDERKKYRKLELAKQTPYWPNSAQKELAQHVKPEYSFY